jgi:hypothetical protein
MSVEGKGSHNTSLAVGGQRHDWESRGARCYPIKDGEKEVVEEEGGKTQLCSVHIHPHSLCSVDLQWGKPYSQAEDCRMELMCRSFVLRANGYPNQDTARATKATDKIKNSITEIKK